LPDFWLRTTEVVSGLYRVEGRDLDFAKAKLQRCLTGDQNWNGVEQVSYMCFDVDNIEEDENEC
jgi:hypothetical protein